MTNVVEFEGRGVLERQAREWLICLDSDDALSEAERAALRAWLASHPAHEAELSRLSRFWKQANILTELAVPLEPAAHARAASNRRNWRGMALAASVLLAVALGSQWLHRPGGAGNETYRTAVGGQQTIPLPDGSSIRLNTDSQVEVAYTSHARTVRLLRGEALFSVAKDPGRAFEVHAADGIVRAIGTAFLVHLEGRALNVTVTQGVVDISQLADARDNVADVEQKAARTTRRLGRLEAGQMTRFISGSDHIDVQQLAAHDLQRRVAWQDGYLAFSGEPLSQVIKQVNRYSPMVIEIADPALASVAIGGRFRIGDLEAVLEALEEGFGIRSVRLDDRFIRLESARTR